MVGPLPAGLVHKLESRFELVPLWTQADRQTFLREQQGQFVGGVTMSRHGGPADVLACLQGTVLVCFGVGFDGIDLPSAQQHRVMVSNTPDVLTDCVADLGFGLILATARQLLEANRFVQRGDWIKGSYPLATRVSGKKLGIVGLGRIGQAVAKRAQGFDMQVRYHGRQAHTDTPHVFEADLLALARWCDFLVLTCVGGPSTHHLINTSVLQALGPESYLINIARGSVVDEAALIQALNANQIAGVGLDVLENEPQVPEPLRDHARVTITPHIAASTRETREAMEQLVVNNLLQFLQHGTLLTPVQALP
jgi:lactate dehydrogenase-like 2-hydroxyacid dehydrogenase